jgi:adenylosuccinate synthase
MSLWVVVGGQFGSEGKGKVAAFITQHENIDVCVRCGGPNSGHSFVDDGGQTVVLRQLPTGFINPRTRLLIPAGALIDPEVLKQEIEMLGIASERVGIDSASFIIEDRDREQELSLGLRERLSSTLCGVGSAQSRRILRGSDAKLAKDAIPEFPWLARYLTNVSDEVNSVLDQGKSALIEGTQGFGLSLYHSDFYPCTTSRDTTAASFLSEVGVSPCRVTEVVAVFRTFPIRVAGQQAGPLSQEITWEQIQQESGYRHTIEERTTVTKMVRRVGRFDLELARRAVQVNRPTRIALNGLDYLDFRNGDAKRFSDLCLSTRGFIRDLERDTGVPIAYLGVGPSLSQIIPMGGEAVGTRPVVLERSA